MMMMMKKRVSTTAIAVVSVCLFVVVLIQIISLSTTSTLSTSTYAYKTKSQERTTEKVKKPCKPKPNPLPPSPNSMQLPHPNSERLPVESRISCDRTHLRYDMCSISGPTVLDPTTSTFFVSGPRSPTRPVLVEKIRPYPRKFEGLIMSQIKDLILTAGTQSPSCKVHHKVPALVFSAGGYTGNFFHDFNDGLIPLFITVNTMFPNRDFVIVVAEAPNWWPSKYAELLHMFTKHPIITPENEISTHCFPYAKIGLIAHGFMTINQTLIPNSKTLTHFSDILGKAYGHQTHHPSSNTNHTRVRPRLVLASRRNAVGRSILNQDKVIRMIKRVGFDVVVFEPNTDTSLSKSYKLIHSSHVLVGVHGAALTHSLFLRSGSVFLQVIPIGVEWASDAFFGRVARGLNLEYLEYRIGIEESSLVEKYGKDNVLLKDPFALQKNGWPTEIMNVYLKKQNVKLDLVRFKGYLKEAYRKAKNLMQKES